MERSAIHRQIAQGAARQTYPERTVHITDMDYSLALLLPSLLQILSLGTAAPLSREALNMRSKVKLNAEQLVRKIELYSELLLPRSPTIDLTTEGLGGLSSVVWVLGDYESLLSEDLDGSLQLKEEVSSLRGLLDGWRQRNCGETQRPKMHGRLAELQSSKDIHTYTVTIEALMGLKGFLNQLLKNLDLLGTC